LFEDEEEKKPEKQEESEPVYANPLMAEMMKRNKSVKNPVAEKNLGDSSSEEEVKKPKAPI